MHVSRKINIRNPMPRVVSKTIALIGGTGMVWEPDHLGLTDATVHTNVTVKFGSDSGRVLHHLEGYQAGLRVIVLPRHGPTLAQPDRSPAMLLHEKGYEAHIWLLHQLGVSAVYAFSAVGALDRDIPLASELCFVVPHDYARGLGASTHSFGVLARTVHPSMREPFAPELRAQAIAAITAAGATALSTGLYICSGPDQFESTAEVRATMRLYAGETHRVVGMTAGPELVLCRQMEIPYVVICANANYAEGLDPDAAVTHELVVERMQRANDKLADVASEIVRIAAAQPVPGDVTSRK
jgi:5'-methylthioadenosine phosphorylase